MDKIMQITFKNSCSMVLRGTTGGEKVGTVAIGNKDAYTALVEESEVEEFVSIVHLGEDHPAHPDSYTSVVLTEEWAKSFAKAVKESPKPLFIPGHTDASVGYKMRAIPDGYVTGGKVQDGETVKEAAIRELKEEITLLIFNIYLKEIAPSGHFLAHPPRPSQKNSISVPESALIIF